MKTTNNSAKNAKKAVIKSIFPTVAELSAMAEAPKAEVPKAEAPKAEAPKAEAPKAEAPKAEAPKAEAPKAEAPKAEAPKAVVPISFDELTDKVERVYLLKLKYAEIREKKQRLERFTIKNDTDTAVLTLRDAKGETITTHNPRAIGSLLADWAKDLSERLFRVEEEMRRELGAC